MEEIGQLIEKETSFFLSQRSAWSLTVGPQTLEVTAHALRVVLHTGKTRELAGDFLALVHCQDEDGGWSSYSADATSSVWVSAFCALMLLRGNRILKEERITQSVRKAIDYFLGTQKDDGRWTDLPTWSALDATSHPVSFFHVVRACGETHRKEETRKAWEKGLRLILNHQSPDGAWYDPDFKPTALVVASGSPVEMTAHLVQDSLVADLVMENALGVGEACAKAARWLQEHQAETGSWDCENVDHTMDSTRSLMLVTKVLGEKEGEAVIRKALRWIVSIKNDRGWGDFPGEETNIERTCDGLDTLIKYRAYCELDPQATIKLWGYIPE